MHAYCNINLFLIISPTKRKQEHESKMPAIQKVSSQHHRDRREEREWEQEMPPSNLTLLTQKRLS